MERRWLAALAVAAATLGAASLQTQPVAAAGPARIEIVTTTTAGPVLTDGDGRVLYLFTRDERNTTNCSGQCAVTWPPLMTDGAPIAGAGVAANQLRTIARPEGGQQVTYNGWPLYYFRQDAAPKETKGQNVGGNWFVVSPEGGPRQNQAILKTGVTGAGTALVDASGRSLYLFTRDEPMKTNCTGNCAIVWPPFETIGTPRLEGNVNPGLVGTITRADGSTQITYNGWPLYYYNQDDRPGDAMGQAVAQNTWWVVDAAGKAIQTPPMRAPGSPAARPAGAPSALPNTGDEAMPFAAAAAAAGLVLLAGSRLTKRTNA